MALLNQSVINVASFGAESAVCCLAFHLAALVLRLCGWQARISAWLPALSSCSMSSKQYIIQRWQSWFYLILSDHHFKSTITETTVSDALFPWHSLDCIRCHKIWLDDIWWICFWSIYLTQGGTIHWMRRWLTMKVLRAGGQLWPFAAELYFAVFTSVM